jgi:parallel beta-helix repeat protein
VSSNNLFDNTRVYNNGWWGYHLFHSGDHTTVNNNIISNSEVYNNGTQHAGAYGIIVSSGSNNEVRDSIIRDNPNGIQVAYDSVNARISNNTIHDNRGGSIDLSNTTNTIVENNIVYGNGWGIVDWGDNPGLARSNNTE